MTIINRCYIHLKRLLLKDLRGLTEDGRSGILSDFDKASNNELYIISLKCCDYEVVPLKLAGLSNPNEEQAREA